MLIARLFECCSKRTKSTSSGTSGASVRDGAVCMCSFVYLLPLTHNLVFVNVIQTRRSLAGCHTKV